MSQRLPWRHRGCRAALAAVAALALVLACSESAESPLETSRDAGAQPASNPERDAFIQKLRRAYEAGDALALDRLFNWEGTPKAAVQFLRTSVLPQGPMQVVNVRIEALDQEGELRLESGDQTLVLNVEPEGRLVVDVLDLSGTPVSKGMIFGKKDGVYRLAGVKPRE